MSKKNKCYLEYANSDAFLYEDDEWLNFGINGSKKKGKKKKKNKKKDKKSKKGKSEKRKCKDTLAERLIEKTVDSSLSIVADGFHQYFEKKFK